MNFCFCILPRLFGCTFPSIYVYLLSAVCVCDRARLGATEIHPVSFHVSSSVPAASLFSLAAQIKELTHAAVSFLFSISNSHFLALSFSLTPIFLSLYPAFSPTISVGILIPLQQRSKLSMQTR